jgi:hypothetical protein
MVASVQACRMIMAALGASQSQQADRLGKGGRRAASHSAGFTSLEARNRSHSPDRTARRQDRLAAGLPIGATTVGSLQLAAAKAIR